MEAFYDENGGKDGVREWSLGRGAPRGWGFSKPPEDRGFKQHTFTADKHPQLCQGGAYREEGHQPISRGPKNCAFKRGRGGQLCLLAVGGCSYRACAAPLSQEPTAFAHKLQSVHPSHPRVLVTLSSWMIGVQRYCSERIPVLREPCFSGLRRLVDVGVGVPGFVFFLFSSSFFSLPTSLRRKH